MPGVHGAGCGCVHEEDLSQTSKFLLPWIDVDNVTGLNEEEEGTAKKVFRPYDTRLDDTKLVESPEGDPELMIVVPFTSPVKLASVIIIGGDEGTSPSKVRLYINREGLDFSSVADVEPTQELDLIEDFHGAVERPVRAAKFAQVTLLHMFFPESFGEDRTRIHWIGLKGIGSEYKREAVTCVYEAVPNAADHPKIGEDSAGSADVS
eukprot:gnl/MRDRNA2_/MRDRNA2_249472_c0_seq1.p1 gnl/MRDRNA2_/MRDRNA2_249472_c0~~gnl/MRDRNA2_/MRDRNA2_249472_c0_seq1.p1  ORF type:complete len:207 (+),score=44.38 gnl/MRDRNA2_/MRDRNA2_249472_c0_seq1:42-662(+)